MMATRMAFKTQFVFPLYIIRQHDVKRIVIYKHFFFVEGLRGMWGGGMGDVRRMGSVSNQNTVDKCSSQLDSSSKRYTRNTSLILARAAAAAAAATISI